MTRKNKNRFVILMLLYLPFLAVAGEANVVDVSYQCAQTCSFSVTIQHDDEGWKHYANRWEILSIDRTIIATRVLAHPHSKAPFTRSLSNIKLPKNTHEVIVRAHDLIHGYGGKELKIKLK